MRALRKCQHISGSHTVTGFGTVLAIDAQMAVADHVCGKVTPVEKPRLPQPFVQPGFRLDRRVWLGTRAGQSGF